SSRTFVVPSPISVSSPPMIPARAIGRSVSAMSRSSGSRSRSIPSRVRSFALIRATDDDLAASQRVVVEGMQRVAERQHHVVGDVDDVRDRAHPGREQARLQPERRRPDPDVAEKPADVARTGLEVLDLDLDANLWDV